MISLGGLITSSISIPICQSLARVFGCCGDQAGEEMKHSHLSSELWRSN
jgi:hypothetical protein